MTSTIYLVGWVGKGGLGRNNRGLKKLVTNKNWPPFFFINPTLNIFTTLFDFRVGRVFQALESFKGIFQGGGGGCKGPKKNRDF